MNDQPFVVLDLPRFGISRHRRKGADNQTGSLDGGTPSNSVLTALQPPLNEDDLSNVLLTMGMVYLDVLLSTEGLALYRALISAAPHFPDLARAFFENGPGRASRHLAEFLREQKANGVIDVDDPQIAAEHVLGPVRGDVHLTAALGVRKPSSQLVKATVFQGVETFLRGAKPAAGK